MSEPPIHSEGELTGFRNRNFQFRTESRYKSPLAALAYIRTEENSDHRETVWLANVSYHGVGFLTKVSIAAKVRLLIEIPALSNIKRDVVVEVMHATQQLNGDWLIGCQLNAALTHEELEECLTFDSPFMSVDRA